MLREILYHICYGGCKCKDLFHVHLIVRIFYVKSYNFLDLNCNIKSNKRYKKSFQIKIMVLHFNDSINLIIQFIFYIMKLLMRKNINPLSFCNLLMKSFAGLSNLCYTKQVGGGGGGCSSKVWLHMFNY